MAGEWAFATYWASFKQLISRVKCCWQGCESHLLTSLLGGEKCQGCTNLAGDSLESHHELENGLMECEWNSGG
jgi:hypothetical protein